MVSDSCHSICCSFVSNLLRNRYGFVITGIGGDGHSSVVYGKDCITYSV